MKEFLMPHVYQPLTIIAVFLAFGMIGTNAHGQTSVPDSSIDVFNEAYPELYEAVLSRDANAILEFTSHTDRQVRKQAWRALAQTSVNSLDRFIEKALQSDLSVAWFAISMHDPAGPQLRGLETYWTDHPGQRAGISLVLGRQGDEQSFSFLMSKTDEISGSDYEAEVALAISRLLIRFPITEKQQQKIIKTAFSSDEPDLIRRWLYGFYRGDDMLTSSAKDSLIQQWQSYGMGESADIDQYVAGIVGAPVFADIIREYQSSGDLQNHVQLGIELAQLTGEVDLSQQNVEHFKKLINHPNPHVAQQTLAELSGRLASGAPLFSFIKSELMGSERISPFVWLQALNTAATVDSAVVLNHADRLYEISNSYPYLYPQVLQAWMKVENSDAFLNRVGTTIGEGDPLKSMYTINALDAFWSDAEHTNQLKSSVRDITFDALALKDRAVTYSTPSLLQDSLLFIKADFQRINRYLNAFSLPGDIEVYQTFGSLYKERFEKQARPVIDSLAALGYAPLNRSLKQAGWDVKVPESEEQKFRIPDWKRLLKLGHKPVWVLETEKGTIKVEMNTLSAPATVSAIDSLTRTGAYDGVPFHRVVPNFVIQGGDIERRDGFGGPDFTIPTEPSEQGFVRGAAGIASAGTDTEGSQYFFMHQWKPHLNGNYTLFGQIIEGIEVVDRIIAGHNVKRAYWE